MEEIWQFIKDNAAAVAAAAAVVAVAIGVVTGFLRGAVWGLSSIRKILKGGKKEEDRADKVPAPTSSPPDQREAERIVVQEDKVQPRDGPDKPTVFISYSHKDEDWKDRLRPHLGVLERADRITIWDDRRIGGGEEWYEEIREAMDLAAVAVCLISADFLSSKFCTEEEVPYLLTRRERHGMILIPVLLRPCAWKAVSWLSAIQMIPRDGKAVARDFKEDWEAVFAQVAESIFEIL